MRLLVEVTRTPWRPLATAAVPFVSVPMKLPATLRIVVMYLLWQGDHLCVAAAAREIVAHPDRGLDLLKAASSISE